jgi:CubicO group peptidase (beta-lactamase class C family)
MMDAIGATGWPDATWGAWADPASAGFDPPALAGALARAAAAGSAAVLVVRGGRIVASLGAPARKLPCHSIRKSLLSALIGIAVEEGRIELSASLESLGIDDHDRLSAIERTATVYDLLTARSGIMHPTGYESARMRRIKPPRHLHAPTTRWTYNNWDFNALGTIYEQCTGEPIPDAFARRIAAPLGMEDFSLTAAPPDAGHVGFTETAHRAYPFSMTARDLARFGLLWLRQGRWRGRQIVPAAWVRNSVQPVSEAGHEGAYGYMWWVCRQGVMYPNVILPADAHAARGVGGHVVLVVPSLDLVVVHRADTSVQPIREVNAFTLGPILEGIVNASE